VNSFRVLLFDALGNPRGELSREAGTLYSCTRSEEINGEHYLSIETEVHLEVGTRAVTKHKDGRWREWVVDEPGETHDTGTHARGTYHMCWSIQYDLQTVYGSIVELGMVSPAGARQALSAALDGTKRWRVGTCDVTTKASSVVMNADESAWDRLTTIVKRWGGEIDAEITVNDFGVTSRKVALLDHLGTKEATRRFEWGYDLTSITRTPDPGPYYCRVIPLGNGESEEAADGTTTYDVKMDITSSPAYVDNEKGLRHDSGSRYIRDVQSELLFRVSDGSGGYEYPCTVVSFSTEDQEELFELAKEDALSKTRPGISYTGSVVSFREAGMDVDGLGLGDEVHVVDLGFNPGVPLRIQERVLKMEIDELADTANLSIGRLNPSLERTLATVTRTIGTTDVSYNMPQWDASKYAVSTPTLSHYTVSKPNSDGLTYTVPTYDVSRPDYGSALSDLNTRLGAVEAVTGVGAGSSGSAALDDGIIHQLNGVQIGKGSVINFTTTSKNTSSGQSGTGSGSGSGYSPQQGPVKDSWGNAGAPTLYNQLMAGSGGFVDKGKKTAATWGNTSNKTLANTLFGGSGGFSN